MMAGRVKVEAGTSWLNKGDFIKNWAQWKKTVNEAIKMANH